MLIMMSMIFKSVSLHFWLTHLNRGMIACHSDHQTMHTINLNGVTDATHVYYYYN